MAPTWGGLYNYKDSIWKKINIYPDITFRHLVPSNIAGDSNVWATSIGKTGAQAISGGAYLINTQTETVTQYGSGIAGGLGSRYGNSLALSNQGKIYVALATSLTSGTTNQGGVYSSSTLNPPPPSSTSFTKAIPDVAGTGDIIYHSAGNRGNELWFGRGSNCDGTGFCAAPYIARLTSSGTVFSSITNANSPLPFTNSSTSAFARAIFTDTITGNTFVGLSTGGIGVCKQDGTWKLLTAANSPLPSFAAVNFNAIGEVYGEIWVGTTSGIFVYNGTGPLDSMSSFKMLTMANGLPSDNITDIAVDTARKQIWVTSSFGVSRASYTSPFIKGIVYNVFCNQPGKTVDSLNFFYDVLQKKPIATGVKVRLLQNGIVKDSVNVNADGVFELTKAADTASYTVEIRYKKADKEIIYQYPGIKNHTWMGSILIPDGLIDEIKAFKELMVKRCFKMATKFNIKVDICYDYNGFDVSEYDKAYETFYNTSGVVKDYRKQVENLADFYTSVATVYRLGGFSNELINKGLSSGLAFVESFTEYTKLSKLLLHKSAAVKAGQLAVLKSLKEGLKAVMKADANNLQDETVRTFFKKIHTVIDDMADIAITIFKEGDGAGPKVGMDLLNKYVAMNVASYYYKDFTQVHHQDFIRNAATSSKDAYSNQPYDQTYNRLYNPLANSIHKYGLDTLNIKKTRIDNYEQYAKYAVLTGDFADAGIALGLLPGTQGIAVAAKLLSYSAKAVNSAFLFAAMYQGASGGAQEVTLSDQILPTAGFTHRINNSVANVAYRSMIATDSLVIRKDFYKQKLTELQALFTAPYDSVTYLAKYDELDKADSLYTIEMTKTLNVLWTSADTAAAKIPGFSNKLTKVIDSFVSKQYTIRNAFYFQNLGYIFDSVKTGYIGGLDSLVNNIKVLNDSAVNGIGSLANDITINNITSLAYLVQDDYAINHSHLPGSSGTITYTFKNYGTEPQQNVSFKISPPTAGYTLTSSDSIYIGTIQGGQSKQISFSFTSPLTDSIGRYTVIVKASNGRFSDVTGSLYVNDPLKFYSEKPGNWSDPATWSTNMVPSDNADVFISHNVSVDVDASCKSLSTAVPGIITVKAGKRLTVFH